MKRPHLITFPLDVDAIVKDYARNYLLNSSVHESLDEFAERVASDLKMPDAKKWAVTAVKKMRCEVATI